MFISVLYMFQAGMCPSSGELIVSIRHLVYITPYRWPYSLQVWMRLIQTCTLNGHLYRVTYTRCRIDTILLMMGTWLPETCKGKGKAIPLQAWIGPKGSRRVRLPDLKTVTTW